MPKLIRSRNFLIGLGFAGTLGALAAGQAIFQKDGVQAQNLEAPRYEVDPLWPKPLPNHWVLGMVIGVSVDADDHIWIIHRGSSSLSIHENQLEKNAGDCCAAAPPVLEFDQAGNLLRHWGGPAAGYDWPTSNHGIFVDYKGNVWIGGNGGPDSHILKFTKDGKFLMLTADGRSEASAGIDLYDLADFLLELGAVDALNLDGGGSTTMVLDDKVVNHPSDKGGERKIGDALIVTLRK